MKKKVKQTKTKNLKKLEEEDVVSGSSSSE